MGCKLVDSVGFLINVADGLNRSINTGGGRQRQQRCAQSSDTRSQGFKMAYEFADQQVDHHHSPLGFNAMLINAEEDAFEVRDAEIIDIA